MTHTTRDTIPSRHHRHQWFTPSHHHSCSPLHVLTNTVTPTLLSTSHTHHIHSHDTLATEPSLTLSHQRQQLSLLSFYHMQKDCELHHTITIITHHTRYEHCEPLNKADTSTLQRHCDIHHTHITRDTHTQYIRDCEPHHKYNHTLNQRLSNTDTTTLVVVFTATLCTQCAITKIVPCEQLHKALIQSLQSHTIPCEQYHILTITSDCSSLHKPAEH